MTVQRAEAPGDGDSQTLNPAEYLWGLHAPETYPSGVVAVPDPIVGTAFFPGGFGLWNPKGTRPLPTFPIGGVMVLGHDFHSQAGYEESRKRGWEDPAQPTWSTLRKLLQRAEIPAEECFFTNAYMGLRKGTKTTGVFPGAANKEFDAHCKKFLLTQISTQRPSLILTLGVYAPAILGSLSEQLLQWAGRRGFKKLDESGPVKTHVQFSEIHQYSTTVVALTHPSLRGPNLGRRKYRGVGGDAAELLMLKDAR